MDDEAEAEVPVELVRIGLEVALAVAQAGAMAVPAVDPPGPLRPLFGLTKLATSNLVTVRRALDADDDFRARVAEAIGVLDDQRVEPLFVAWLTRAEGWRAEVARRVDEADRRREAKSDERNERVASRRLAAVERARDRAEEQLGTARRSVDRYIEELKAQREVTAAAQASLATLVASSGKEADAVARADAAEHQAGRLAAELAEARAELDEARAELDEARAELVGVKAEHHRPAAEVAGPRGRSDEGGAAAARTELDRGRAQAAAAVGEAAAAATALGAALGRAAGALAPSRPEESPTPPRPPVHRGGLRRPRHAPVPVPGGMFDDTTEWALHLLRLPGSTVLVDGYNVSIGRWPGLALRDQRDWLIGALGELAAKFGASVRVVFDAIEDEALPPVPSPLRSAVRVAFSKPGEDADEVIIGLVDSLPATGPVVVVTDDRRLRAAVAARGATPLSVDLLLSSVDRGPRQR